MLEGIQDIIGDEARVYYSEGCHLFREKVENLGLKQDRIAEAISVAKNSDIVLVCVGLDESLEGEEGDTGNSYASGDKTDLLLPQVQRELLSAMLNIGKPVIVLNMTGSAMDLREAQEHADAILQVWYPGARGGKTIAQILFGDISPSGKLPITFYNDTKDLPEFEDYNMKGRTYRYIEKKPLYPFGYGLTYGKRVLKAANFNDKYSMSVTVENQCEREFDEVIQIYVKAVDSIDASPNAKLCGFQRIHLLPGEVKETSVLLDEDAYKVVNDNGEKLEQGHTFEISVGFGQPDKRTKELMGEECIKITYN